MLNFIALNINAITITVGILLLISAALALTSISPYSNEKIGVIGGCMTMLCLIILIILSINTNGNYPVSNAKWKTIYKNNLNADVKIAYADFSNKHSLNTNQKQDITDFQSSLNETDNVIKIKLTVTKGDDSITKNVLLEKDNLITKDINSKNAQITKIEYRPIEGTAPKVFGVKSRPNKSDKDGEIRITFKSNNNKELETLFKN